MTSTRIAGRSSFWAGRHACWDSRRLSSSSSVLTFLTTCFGIDRLAGAVWPQASGRAGLAAVVLVLIAKAGNIGTNHLFEAMVLDRLMAMALVWLALARVVSNPARGLWPARWHLGAQALIHPSVGLQASLAVIGSWGLWALLGPRTGVGWKTATGGMLATGLALIPGLVLNLATSRSLLNGLPAADFWVLAVELQSPQHMLPHLWRMPQWLAWASYMVLAGMAAGAASQSEPGARSLAPPAPDPSGVGPPFARGGKDLWPAARLRLALMLAIVLAALGAAWVAIEVLHNIRITIFQPFRMATVARGLALVFIAGKLVNLWERGQWFPRLRSVLIGVALAGDWMLVVMTIAETGVALCEWLDDRSFRGRFAFGPHVQKIVFAGLLGLGLVFLSRHDTESGHWPLLAVLGVGLAVSTFRWATRSGERPAGSARLRQSELTRGQGTRRWGAGSGLAGSRGRLLCRPGSGRPSRGALATGSRTVDTVPVWGHADRRYRTARRLVPAAHTD